MTSKYFIELAEYNKWANTIVCNWLQQISDEQWQQHVISSFNSIEQTALHIASAENAWTLRFENPEQVVWLANDFKGSKAEFIDLWKALNDRLIDYIKAFDENKLLERFEFRRLNGDRNTLLYYEAFAHLFNHSSYHRGQLVTMLRQVGFTGVSSTDLLGFYKSKAQ
jgi:uncharacterized damage-inducible protein DinB